MNRTLPRLPALALALTLALAAGATGAQNADGASAAHPSLYARLLQKLDTDGDGRISEQEWLAAATARFKRIDTQNSGKFDAASLAASPVAAERMQKRADAMLRHLDKAGNGYITEEEVAAAAQKRFLRLDRNGDGKLTPDELAAARHEAGFGRHGFERADANHDGAITQDEYVAAARQRFETLDAQHSGKLTVAEIAAAPHAQQRAAREAERIVQHLDTNGDGAVTLDEYLAAAKKHFSRLDKNGDGYIDADELPAHRWAAGGKAVRVDG